MSTTKLYQIRDNVAQTVTGPIFAQRNDAAAGRMFGEALGNSNSSLSKNPEDYDLFTVGSQDESSGVITPHVELILTGRTVARRMRGEEPAASNGGN